MTAPSSIQNTRKLILDFELLSDENLQKAIEYFHGSTSEEFLDFLKNKGYLTDFQVSKLVRGDSLGYHLGQFTIQYKISAGTFARVFRGVDRITGQTVAVKVLRGRYTIDPATIKNFHREARLIESLHHPNIARMLDVGKDEDTNQHYIAMEFVEGGNLKEILAIRKKLPPREAVEWIREMSEGLKYALSVGVTHRDLKPTNILISSNKTIKLVDFGLAGIVEKHANSIVYSTEQRTVEYAGLEKATDAPKGDPRSDIYFLGAVFYEIIAGEPPLLDIKDKRARMHFSRFVESKHARENENIPNDVANVIDRMMELNPDNRFQTYDAVLNNLNTIDWASVSGNGKPGSGAIRKPKIFVVHRSDKVTSIIKDKLGKIGYQIVITSDFSRATMLHKMSAGDVFVIDLETVGAEGLKEYNKFIHRTHPKHLRPMIFIVPEECKSLVKETKILKQVFLEMPLKLGDLRRAVEQLVKKKPSA